MSEVLDFASPRKVYIVGGGAAGIFTAYELATKYPDHFDVTVLEARKTLGGHTRGRRLEHNGESMHIDCGAQFFYERSEPDYCEMLRREGFLGADGEVTVHIAGMTVYNATREKLTFHVPSTMGGLYREVAKHPINFGRLKKFMKLAEDFFNEGDWTIRFGDWFEGLDLGLKTKGLQKFKAYVLRPLMYQFGLVPPGELDSLSALFVIYFFVNSLPHDDFPSDVESGGSGSNPLFQIYCLKNGMDGVLHELVRRHGLDVECEADIRSIEPEGAGWKIHADDGRSWTADEIVFATNPMRTLEILRESTTTQPIRDLLEQMPYLIVPVHVQAGEPAYMPRAPSDWELSNVRFFQDESGAATHYMMTAWFGPVREAALGRAFFKSWGSPQLEPHDAPTAAIHVHELMVGTPDFIAARENLREKFQGHAHLWFAGGYLLDYDSQNACLKAARQVAEDLEKTLQFKLQSGLDELPELTPARELYEDRPITSGTSFLRWL